MDLTGMLQAAAGATPTGNAWEVVTGEFTGEPLNQTGIFAQQPSVQGIYISPDNLRLYTTGDNKDNINQYDLSVAGDITSKSFVRSFSVAAQDAQPYGVFFKTDGTAMYIVGNTNPDSINEYSLSTAWDISSASHVRSKDISAQGTSLLGGPFFSSDGTKLYTVASTNVHQYSLSTAWNISTISFVATYNPTESSPQAVFFNSTLSRMYLLGNTGGHVQEFSVSSGSVSTASLLRTYVVSSYFPVVRGLFFNSSGSVMYIAAVGQILQFQLSTAGNVSTASYTYPTTDYVSLSAQDDSVRDIFFKPDGTKLYTIGEQNQSVYEYDLSTAWQVETASYVRSFAINAQEVAPKALFFSSDGTKMYVMGVSGDDVNQYSLGTAWNISTASYVTAFSVAGQETTPNSLFFSPDGLNMYVGGQTGDDVNQYSLGTAWNVATASYVRVRSTKAQEDGGPLGLFFKSDGTKMYITGDSRLVHEYDLSTAWDISTTSYVGYLDVSGFARGPTGLTFKDDGTKLFTIDSNGTVFGITL